MKKQKSLRKERKLNKEKYLKGSNTYSKYVRQEMVTISKEEYDLLLEEVGILRNPKMAESIEESDKAKIKGVKTWQLKI